MEAISFTPPSLWETKTDINKERHILKFPSSVNFCSLLNDYSTQTHSSASIVKVVKRIGSESSEGEVYQIKYKDIDAALKMMPIVSDNDISKNKNEISVATLASEMVLENRCENFPIVYGSGKCQNSNFYSPIWKERSLNYACMRKLRQNLPSKTRQMDALYRSGTSPENVAKRFGVDIGLCNNLETPSDFLISELASSDLSIWASSSHTSKEWKSIIYQCLQTIQFMRKEMGICHNDLHWGNILIKSIADYDLALIHDFGKSVPINNENKSDDLVKFISSYTGINYKLPLNIREFFRQSEEDLKNNQGIKEILEKLDEININ